MKRTPERQTHSDNKGGFRFPLLVALWSLVLLLGGISAPAMATTFSFANGSGSDAITSASSAGWTESGETLRFAVSGLSGYYPFACDGLLGVAGDVDCLATGGWAVRRVSSGSATIRVTVSITGKVFDLTSLMLTDGVTSSVGSYSITTSRGGAQSGSVNAGNNRTILNFSGAQFLGISSFTIQFTGGGGSDTAFGLSYLILNNITSTSAPAVSGISPASGLAAGGTSVVITGSNFAAVQGTTGVKFGSSNATSYTVDSDTQITAMAPAGSGTQYITVSNAAGTSATGAASQFTYITVPTVSDLSPASGPLAGGNTVVITGTGLTAATAVKFGANNATGVVVNSATQITATAPAGTAGNVFVTVTTPSGTSATAAGNQYTYVALPVVSGVSPNLGMTAGGSSVTLTGSGFTGATAVTFGATSATSYSVNSDTQITATSPAGTTGTVNVTVVTAGGTSATGASTRYTYAQAPTVATASASAVTATTATLAGNANDNAAETTLSFEYGLSTSYGSTATATPATLSAGAGSTAVSASLSGLVCNTTYHYRVRATNSVGTTLGSDAGFTTTACVPGAPTGVTATAGNMSASVAFTAPTDSGGTAITSYTVTANPGGATGSGSVSPITVTGLTNGTAYTFTVTATNSTGVGPASGASNSVTPINAPPVANAVSTTVIEGSSNNAIALNITGGTPASVAVTSWPSHGTAAASGASITYTPTPGYTGVDSFTYTATNASGTSPPASVSITVSPAPPVANAVSATVAYGSSNNAITLNITGGTAASVAVASVPTHGTATASGTSITYTPGSSYSGADSFTYTATNAGGTSSPATVSITVNLAPPVANAVSAVVVHGSSNNAITLNITGGTAASVAVTSPASHGTATASGASITYTPTTGYTGVDSFTYAATNASGTSPPATVSITVSPAPPMANAVSATVTYGSSGNAITLNISGGAATSVAVASAPTHGTATASGTSIIYTPGSSYSGADSFTYTATNAGGTSSPATVSITVNPQTPTAGNVSLSVEVNSNNNLVALALSGGAASSVAVASAPSHGTATVSGSEIRYTPHTDYTGADSFTYIASNAGGSSAPATVSITVRSRPDPSKDANVRGLLHAQAGAAKRFAQAQILNFQNHLESTHERMRRSAAGQDEAAVRRPDTVSGVTIPRTSGNGNGVTGSTSRTTQGAAYSQTVGLPGQRAGEDLYALPQKQDSHQLQSLLPWSLSALNLGSARRDVYGSGLDIWTAGNVNIGRQSDEGIRFTTSGVSMGAEKLFSDSWLLGGGVGFGHEQQKIGSQGDLVIVNNTLIFI